MLLSSCIMVVIVCLWVSECLCKLFLILWWMLGKVWLNLE